MVFWQLLVGPHRVAVGWLGGQLALLCGTSAFHSDQTPPAHRLQLFVFCGPQFVALAWLVRALILEAASCD